MILGKNGFFVNPSDSLALITANHKHIKYLKEQGIKGVSRFDHLPPPPKKKAPTP